MPADRPSLLPYSLALAAVLVALLVRVLWWPGLFADATFLPLFMAVLFSAWYGGLGPGLLATALGAVSAVWFLFPPANAMAIADRQQGVQLALFLVLALAITVASESLHRTRRRGAQLRGDIDDLEQMQESLRQLAADLSEADRRKDEFLAILSHELRNPLAPIRNSLEMLKHAGDDREVSALAREAMERQVLQLVRLVDDLLDISRISRDKLELREQDFALDAAVANARETAQPLVERYGHTLTVSLPDERVYVHGDLARISQVLGNLLTNAAKYTEPNGRLQLAVEATPDEVQVTVADNGIGVDPEMLPRLFETFSQVDHSLERAQGGLGIGLSLSKRLVEMHGGDIEMHSDGIGTGARVVVRLPRAPAPPQSRTQTSPPGTATEAPTLADADTPCRVLVADDNLDSVTTMQMMLQMLGHEVCIAHDGLEAVDQARKEQPELILLDIGMPGLNGYEACRRIRAMPWAPTALIVALTGWGQEEDRDRSREAGFDLHLIKPLDPGRIETLLQEARKRRDGAATGEQPASEPAR